MLNSNFSSEANFLKFTDCGQISKLDDILLLFSVFVRNGKFASSCPE